MEKPFIKFAGGRLINVRHISQVLLDGENLHIRTTNRDSKGNYEFLHIFGAENSAKTLNALQSLIGTEIDVEIGY